MFEIDVFNNFQKHAGLNTLHSYHCSSLWVSIFGAISQYVVQDAGMLNMVGFTPQTPGHRVRFGRPLILGTDLYVNLLRIFLQNTNLVCKLNTSIHSIGLLLAWWRNGQLLSVRITNQGHEDTLELSLFIMAYIFEPHRTPGIFCSCAGNPSMIFWGWLSRNLNLRRSYKYYARHHKWLYLLYNNV